MIRAILSVALLILLTVLAGGCTGDHRAFTEKDAWYQPLPSGTKLWQWETLDKAAVHEVLAEKQAEAEALLADASGVELTEAQTVQLLGQPLPELTNTKPYLVRGLLLNRETGGFTQPSDRSGVHARLAPLADNGGPTLTHALLANSPAIDAGDNAACPASDQRGLARPQGAACDIGAYEWNGQGVYLPLLLEK